MAFEELYRGYVLIDSSALIALLNTRDQFHEYSRLALADLQHDTNVRVFICNLTIYETFTHLRYDVGWETADQVWELVSNTFSANPLEFRIAHEQKTRELLTTYQANKISFHDAGCATLMFEKRIGRAFSFDSDFSIIGFECFPNF